MYVWWTQSRMKKRGEYFCFRSAHPDRHQTHTHSRQIRQHGTPGPYPLSPTTFFQAEHRGHPRASGVPTMRPSIAVNASFYRSRRDLVAEQQLAMQHRIHGTRQGGSRSVAHGGDDVRWSMHEFESLDISPLMHAATGPGNQ